MAAVVCRDHRNLHLRSPGRIAQFARRFTCEVALFSYRVVTPLSKNTVTPLRRQVDRRIGARLASHAHLLYSDRRFDGVETLAAALAARSGTMTTIASGRRPEVLTELVDGQAPGTTLLPDTSPMNARKQWLAGHLRMRGRLILDDGAARRLREAGSSLLPVGVVDVFGQFSRGEMVACEDRHGERVACGLVNYDAADARRLCGKKSHEIADVLGFMNEEELIHRDNMVVL